MSSRLHRVEDTAIYNDHAADWWSSNRYLPRGLRAMIRPRMKWFGRIAGSWVGQRVLDLGCGGGFMAEAIADQGADVIGVDPAAAALEAARAHAAGRRSPIRYELGRAEDIPLPDHSVDRVVCVDVLEHVDDLARTCREIRRVLKPGGVLLFDTINRTWLSRWVVIGVYERLLRVAPHGTHDFHKLIRPDELKRHLDAAGLACGRMVGLGPIGFNWRGDPVFARLPVLGIGYMGAATRVG
jgi:2-polyprenyl-6-hydroxyphenyl methylase / 3-demethylubiquinone-9 3-methyltransferase